MKSVLINTEDGDVEDIDFRAYSRRKYGLRSCRARVRDFKLIRILAKFGNLNTESDCNRDLTLDHKPGIIPLSDYRSYRQESFSNWKRREEYIQKHKGLKCRQYYRQRRKKIVLGG